MIDNTREVNFPYMNEGFNGIRFIEKQDNFKKTENVQSSLIFRQNNLNTNEPFFTIAIPTYNRLDTLKEAIESAINQDLDSGGGNLDSKKSYEIIVVENCNNINEITDTQILLETNYKNKLTYYKNHKNLGLFGNWNRCIKLAQGKWVCLLHDDDILFNNYLSEMQYATSKVSKVAMISSDAVLFGKGLETNMNYIEELEEQKARKTIKGKIKNVIKKMIFHKYIDEFYFTNKDCHLYPTTKPSALLHNKDKCIQIGGYNQDFYPMDDIFGALRAAIYCGIAHYKKTTNAKRLDISQGTTKNLCKEYSLQHYFFTKDCLKYNSIYKRYLLYTLLEWPLQSNKANRDATDRFYNDYDIDIKFNIFEKIIIILTKYKHRLLGVIRNSKLFFAYKNLI